MRRLKIQHNDLHLNNILIKKLKTPKTTLYCIGNNINRWFCITSIYSVKFFDWDLAYSPLIGDNKKVDKMCKYYGVCNILHPLFDQTIFLCQLLENMKSQPNVTKFIKNTARLPQELIDTAEFDCRISANKMLKHSDNMTSSTSLMKNVFFDEYKINKNNIKKININNVYTLPKVDRKKIIKQLIIMNIQSNK